jgi:hypothetical protein
MTKHGYAETVDSSVDDMQLLSTAINYGVHIENGVYRFMDPGIPLVLLRDLPTVRSKGGMLYQNWYDQCDWAHRRETLQERCLRLQVDRSLGKDFSEQRILLNPDEEVAPARIVLTYLVMLRLETDVKPSRNWSLRCQYDASSDVCAVAHFFISGTLGIVRSSNGKFKHDILGLAALGKS